MARLTKNSAKTKTKVLSIGYDSVAVASRESLLEETGYGIVSSHGTLVRPSRSGRSSQGLSKDTFMKSWEQGRGVKRVAGGHEAKYNNFW
jgi:hypothetical protein